MIICPNKKNPEVAREFNELVQATSEQAAYHIWSLNNGNAIDKAPNGAESKLFQTLLEYYGGDRTKAIQAKAKTYGNSFLTWFGDWINDSENASKVVDENGEPLIDDVLPNVNQNSRSHPDVIGKLNKKYITNQLIKHLKSIGINVHDRQDMIKYLREHGLAGLQKSIERKAGTGYGVTIQTEALNITGNKFKNSLYRGQGYTPIIDAEGNLHLHTNYDSLSKLRTLSFDSTIEGAEHYGNRSARHPYIIEVDEDFLDTVVPKEDYNRDKVDRGESFRYDEEFNEVRLSFKDELIIPKGRFNITQTNETLQFESFNDIMGGIGWLQSLEERSEIEEYNGASEITGRVHENDMKALSNALHNTLGTYEGYDVSTILYDVLALQNDTAGSPIAPSRQYKEFINKGLIETEYQNGYTYYRPSKAIVKYLTKKLGLKEVSETSQPILYQSPHAPYSPYTSLVESDLPFFLTPSGEVYGFVVPNGDIYLDETRISPEHPIHEYTHLWDAVVYRNNRKLWDRGVQLMKRTSEWKSVLNDDNYGKKWLSMPNITDEKLEFLVASEVHARLSGINGEQILNRIASERGNKNIVQKLREWMLDVQKSLKSTFSNWSKSDIQNLTLEDFNNMVVRDLVNGNITNLNFAFNIQFARSRYNNTEENRTIVQNALSYEVQNVYNFARKRILALNKLKQLNQQLGTTFSVTFDSQYNPIVSAAVQEENMQNTEQQDNTNDPVQQYRLDGKERLSELARMIQEDFDLYKQYMGQVGHDVMEQCFKG